MEISLTLPLLVALFGGLQVTSPLQQKPAPEEMRVAADDIDKVLKEGKAFFLDVREPKELEELGTLEGYVNIPLSQLESRLSELPKDRPILTA